MLVVGPVVAADSESNLHSICSSGAPCAASAGFEASNRAWFGNLIVAGSASCGPAAPRHRRGAPGPA